MPYLGAFAQATLKAAVINAENRNRLTEEDKCWREKEKSSSSASSSSRKRTIESDRAEQSRIKVTRLKQTKHIDKWDNDGYYTNHPEDIGPALPPNATSKSPNTDRFKFFAKKNEDDDDVIVVEKEKEKKKKKKSKKTKKSSSRSRRRSQ